MSEDKLRDALRSILYTELADSILALPEMVELREKADKWDKWKVMVEKLEKELAEVKQLNIYEKGLRETREKDIEDLNEALKQAESFNVRGLYETSLRQRAEGYQAECEELKKELAEARCEHKDSLGRNITNRWGKCKICHGEGDYHSHHQALIDCQKDLSTIMADLIVEEKHTCNKGKIWHLANGDWSYCKGCHGTGYIKRPATPQEVREYLEMMLEWDDKPIPHRMQSTTSTRITHILKSGGRMRLKHD